MQLKIVCVMASPHTHQDWADTEAGRQRGFASYVCFRASRNTGARTAQHHRDPYGVHRCVGRMFATFIIVGLAIGVLPYHLGFKCRPTLLNRRGHESFGKLKEIALEAKKAS